MLHLVALIRIDVSEELSASFIRMTRIGELGIMLAVTSNQRILFNDTVRLLFNGYSGGFFSAGHETDHHFELVPRSRECRSIHPLPMCLHGIVLNELSTGKIILYLRCQCQRYTASGQILDEQ
jgi:hypothetical protein